MPTLPTPSQAALEHSQALLQRIQQEIAENNGHISFARFMELALYAPGLGYYSAGLNKFGKQGDFITAPEISPLFAKCIARQCKQVLDNLGGGDILELGAGTGKFAADLLTELEKLKCLPTNYFILEISADLRARQKDFLQNHCPHLLPRIQWLNELPTQKIDGIIFANEVLDALPVTCFRIENNALKERSVSCNEQTLQWQLTPPSSELLENITALQNEINLPKDYDSETNLFLKPWITTIADTLNKGLLLLIDYGYGRRDYYNPDRSSGTLMCHYQHHRHDDPLILVGLQDITAHVNFTAVAEQALATNLELAGYTTQASFLFACGLQELVEQSPLPTIENYQQNQAIKLLTLPSQMGEIIKVMGLTKNVAASLLGFSLYDRRRDL